MAYSVGIVGSISGLMVITVERYVKIVHSMVHKRFYQPWMLTAGISLPWINGVLQTISGIYYSSCKSKLKVSPCENQVIPVMALTTKVSEGRCYPMSYWPSPEFVYQFSYGLFTISANFFLPVVAFVYCYGRIGVVIWRRRKPPLDHGLLAFDRALISATVDLSVTCNTTETVTADVVARRVQIQRAHARQTNVIKTLAIVSLIFFICWLPIEVLYVLVNAGYPIDMANDLWYACSFLSYVNLLLNPLLYAWQYETVRTSVRILANQVLVMIFDNDSRL